MVYSSTYMPAQTMGISFSLSSIDLVGTCDWILANEKSECQGKITQVPKIKPKVPFPRLNIGSVKRPQEQL